MTAAVDIAALRAAIDWGTDRARPAWRRAEEAVERSAGAFRPDDLDAARSRVLAAIDQALPDWAAAMARHDVADADVAPATSPRDTWQAMLAINEGGFATPTGRDLLLAFATTVGSTIPGTGPIYLRAGTDGWGMAPDR